MPYHKANHQHSLYHMQQPTQLPLPQTQKPVTHFFIYTPPLPLGNQKQPHGTMTTQIPANYFPILHQQIKKTSSFS